MKKSTFHDTGATILTKLLLVMILAMGGCGPTIQKDKKEIIAVSILPQQFFVEKICGDLFKVQTMIPPGESPATYDPAPEQMIMMSRASVYFLIGHIQFENAWIRKSIGDHPTVQFIDTSEGIEFQEEVHGSHGHDHGSIDPHTWMSVNNVRIITQNMTRQLISKYPQHQEVFRANLRIFHQEINELDQQIKQDLDSLEKRAFIIYHPALTYFSKDYNLKQIPIEKEGKEPSAHYMKTLIDYARANDIRAILVQKQFNQDEARIIEKEIGGQIISIDPLSRNWSEQMLIIAKSLKNALTTP